MLLLLSIGDREGLKAVADRAGGSFKFLVVSPRSR